MFQTGPREEVSAARFELATSRLAARRSVQTELRRHVGGGGRIRTGVVASLTLPFLRERRLRPLDPHPISATRPGRTAPGRFHPVASHALDVSGTMTWRRSLSSISLA